MKNTSYTFSLRLNKYMKSLSIPVIEEKRIALLYRTYNIKINQQIRIITGLDDFLLCGTTQGIFPLKLSDMSIGNRLAKSYSPVTSIDIRRDQKLIIHGEENGAITSSIIEKRQSLRKFYGLLGRPFVVRFTPDGYHIIGANGSGHVIIWDLGLGEAQFAAAVFKEQITSIEFINQQTAAVSSIDGNITIIDILSTTIEQDISEAKPRKAIANYILGRISLDNVVKIKQMIYLGQNIMLVLCGDHLQIIKFTNNWSQFTVLARSQQVVHGIQQVFVFDESGKVIKDVYKIIQTQNQEQELQEPPITKYAFICGCNDGTIRRFYNTLLDHEILYSLKRNLCAFYCFDATLFLAAATGEQQLIVIAEQCKGGDTVSHSSALDRFQEKNKFLLAKEEFAKPRTGVDVVVRVSSAIAPLSEAAVFLGKCNYPGALETALFEGFETLTAVLREIEAIGGRAGELAVAGLSDQGLQTLLLYAKDSIETEFLPIYMRVFALVLRVKEGMLSQAVAIQLHELQEDINEWNKAINDGLSVFS